MNYSIRACLPNGRVDLQSTHSVHNALFIAETAFNNGAQEIRIVATDPEREAIRGKEKLYRTAKRKRDGAYVALLDWNPEREMFFCQVGEPWSDPAEWIRWQDLEAFVL